MWYPIIFVLSILVVFAIVIRRALVLGPISDDQSEPEEDIKDHVDDLPQNPGDSEDANEIFKKAEALYKEKKYFAAEKWYKDTLHKDPEFDKAWARLGTIALGQKRYKPAIENLERSVEINPNVPSRHYNLALAYFLDGNNEHALASINIALKSDPQKANYLELKEKIEDENR